jgi:hypothetical protein
MLSIATLIAPIGWFSLAFGVGLLGHERQRRIGATGLLLMGVALAAGRTLVGEPSSATADADLGFLVVNSGLLLLGLALTGGATWADGPGAARLPARMATALGLALIGAVAAREVSMAVLWRAVAVAAGLALAGAGMIALGRGVAAFAPIRTIGGRLFGPPLGTLRPTASRVTLAAMIAGAIAVATGPHVLVVFVGFLAASWASYLAWREPAGRPAPLAPMLVVVLVPAYWLLATIAGPVGLRISQLEAVPLSPAAESLIAVLLLLAAWSVAGLWPLHRQMPGAITGALGAMLIARLVLPLVPGGLDQWRPLVVPLVLLGAWHAAAHARWTLVAVAGALLGLTSGAPAGVTGAWWLVGTALSLELMMMRAGAAPLPVRVTEGAAAAWGGLQVLTGALQGEVVYTTLGTIGLALLTANGSRRVKNRGMLSPKNRVILSAAKEP